MIHQVMEDAVMLRGVCVGGEYMRVHARALDIYMTRANAEKAW